MKVLLEYLKQNELFINLFIENLNYYLFSYGTHTLSPFIRVAGQLFNYSSIWFCSTEVDTVSDVVIIQILSKLMCHVWD